MSDVVYPYASGLIHWLFDYARIAVQAFLVVGGFLAARSMAPRLEFMDVERPTQTLPVMLWRRYVRLARPYLAALVATIGASALARLLIDYPATPAAPTLAQIVAHIFLVQGITGQESLSAGVWYVSIDFQLYGLLLLLLWLARVITSFTRVRTGVVALALCLVLVGASLLWWNLQPSLDNWAPYFFGAYGLGILAQWISSESRSASGLAGLGVLIVAALAVEWRTRILVAGATALLLAATAGGLRAPDWLRGAWVDFLSRISYSVFLIHYAVCLTVGAIVFRLWPASPSANAAGMVAAWLLSLGAGALLHRFVEVRRPPRLRESGIC